MVEEALFFNKIPEMFPMYVAIRNTICANFEDVKVTVQKTQIAFSNKYQFVFVSLPLRKIKDSPGVYILLTLGMGRKIEHPRIAVSTEPYPGRWTHHIIIENENDVDAQIKEWISEAYHFANTKKRKG